MTALVRDVERQKMTAMVRDVERRAGMSLTRASIPPSALHAQRALSRLRISGGTGRDRRYNAGGGIAEMMPEVAAAPKQLVSFDDASNGIAQQVAAAEIEPWHADTYFKQFTAG
eukprot:gene1882-2563_t